MQHFAKCKIDENGQFSVSRECTEAMGWNTGDIVGMHKFDTNTVVVKLSKKYEPPCCAICKAPNRAKRINDYDICSKCLGIIKNS